LDCTLFALLATDRLIESLREGRWAWTGFVALALGGFIVKTCIETRAGASVFVDSHAAGFAPVPLAHLLGAVAGIAGVTRVSFPRTAGRSSFAPT
jgi:hypothetical protein